MTIYKSKYNLIQLCGYFLWTIGLIGFAIILINIYINEVEDKQFGYQYILPMFFLLPIILSFLTMKIVFFNMPHIIVKNDAIQLNSFRKVKVFNLSEIQYIYFGKIPFKYIINMHKRGIVIIDNDETPFFIYDECYRNINKLKLLLLDIIDDDGKIEKDRFNAKIIDLKEKLVSNLELNVEKFKSFKGIWMFTFGGAVMLFLLSILIISSVSNYGKVDMLKDTTIFSLVIVMFYFQLGGFMNYFKMSNNFLIVSNHFWFWRKKIFRFSEIREVIFETFGNSPITVRIITKDFKSKTFMASSLRRKNWNNFYNALKDNDIVLTKEVDF